jgi:glycosyltransferase involved in cell wall biosynthesis
LANVLAFRHRLDRALELERRRCGTAPDLVLASSPHPFAWPTVRRFCGRHGCAFVPEVRDLWPESLVQLAGLSAGHPMVRWCHAVTRQAYRSADAVASTLDGIEPYLLDKGLRCPPVITIPNGATCLDEGPAPLPPGLARELADAEARGQAVLLYVGALGIPNALCQLLDAVKLLSSDDRARLRCVIIGHGSESGSLRERSLANRLGCVAFLDPVAPGAADHAMRRAHAGFIGWLERPLYRHGLSPQKLPMMLNAGLPVVQALPSIVPTGPTDALGWRCDAESPQELAEALRRMLACTGTARAELGARCRAWARSHLDWDGIARRALGQLAQVAR